MSLNPLALWEQMTILNKGVIIILIILVRYFDGDRFRCC